MKQLKEIFMDGKNRKDIYAGLTVDIVLKKDQRTGKRTRGIVQNILTSSPNHPRGIKVRLSDGQIGRVQEIFKWAWAMNIQIFGVKKCFDTQKAERYFKEKNIKYQLVDLKQKGLSKGELQSVKMAVGLANLINPNTKAYKKLNLDRIVGSQIREELLINHPELYITPIVRNGKLATVGYKPEIWKEWE